MAEPSLVEAREGRFSILRPGRGGGADEQRAAFARAVALGLTDCPRWLPCRYLYDERGSRLFEAICRLPEYYLTRAEESILVREADALRALAGPATLVELGAGTAAKTRHLLRAWLRAAGASRYVAVDVDGGTLTRACRELVSALPGLEVVGVAADYDFAFDLLPRFSPCLLAFLGSSIGNLDRVEEDRFWERVVASLRSGDRVLLGLDLVKDAAALEAAYDDAAGVSADFARNLLVRLNTELGGDVDPEGFGYLARFDPVWSRVEMYLVARAEQRFTLRALRRSFRVPAGARILTEISRKYELDDAVAHLEAHGLRHERTWTDEARRFALLLLRRP